MVQEMRLSVHMVGLRVAWGGCVGLIQRREPNRR